MKKVITNNFEKTQDLAGAFIREILGKGKNRGQALIVALEGDLGSGKTTFSQGLAQGLGINENVNSPTFVLIKQYRIKNKDLKFKNFIHIDCYRINRPWQIEELGIGEMIGNPENIIVIEWPEKISEILPEDRIIIKFEFIDENKRKIIFP